MRKIILEKWRTLSMPYGFVEALVELGMDRKTAEEYCDDPKALPQSWKKKLNAFVENLDREES